MLFFKICEYWLIVERKWTNSSANWILDLAAFCMRKCAACGLLLCSDLETPTEFICLRSSRETNTCGRTLLKHIFFFSFRLVFIICYESSSALLICHQSSLLCCCCHTNNKVVAKAKIYFYFATSGCFLYLTLDCLKCSIILFRFARLLELCQRMNV